MTVKDTKSKSNKVFLIIIISFFLLAISAISGFAYIAWKAYPVIMVLKNKNIAQNNFNLENANTGQGNNSKVVVEDKIKEDIKTTYYDISGSNSAELRNQMETLGPEATSEVRYYAMTNYGINWTDTIATTQGCTPVQAELNVEYIMPRWVNYNDASQELQQNWNTFYALLQKHEEGHKEIAEQETQKFLDEIKKIKNYNSCDDFENAIYPIQEKYLLETAQLEKNYDDATNHGVNEGVVLD